MQLTRLDTGATEEARWSNCDMWKDKDTGCSVVYKRFFNDDVVMKWEQC